MPEKYRLLLFFIKAHRLLFLSIIFLTLSFQLTDQASQALWHKAVAHKNICAVCLSAQQNFTLRYAFSQCCILFFRQKPVSPYFSSTSFLTFNSKTFLRSHVSCRNLRAEFAANLFSAAAAAGIAMTK